MFSTKYLRLTSTIAIIFGLLIIKAPVLGSNTKDVINSFLLLSWHVDNPKNITKTNLTKKQIGDFINALMETKYSGLCNQHGEEIGEFSFIDLNSDKIFELILTADGTCGRKFYNTIMIVSRRNDEFSYQTLYHLYNLLNLQGIIYDLNGDGRQELIITRIFSDYCGACPKAFWTDIYSQREGEYIEASKDFSDYYYNQVIPRLEKKISDLQTQLYVADEMKLRKEIILSCYHVELDKALRFLGVDTTAGLERAKKWMISDVPELRRNAVAVFKEIINEETNQYLTKLAKDPDKNVAIYAKEAPE